MKKALASHKNLYTLANLITPIAYFCVSLTQILICVTALDHILNATTDLGILIETLIRTMVFIGTLTIQGLVLLLYIEAFKLLKGNRKEYVKSQINGGNHEA